MKTECRPFRLSDAMILMAAMGPGMGWLTYWIRSEGPVPFLLPFRFSNPKSWILTAWVDIERGVPPFAVFLSLAILILGLRRPHPPWRRAWRQPGQVACLIAVAVSIADAAWRTLLGVIHLVRFRRVIVNYPASLGETIVDALAEYPPTDVGVGVLVAWATLALSGWWRPSSCWIDRLGRSVGLAWITVNFVARTHEFVDPFRG